MSSIAITEIAPVDLNALLYGSATATARWTAVLQRVYLESGRLLEKYDVSVNRPSGGGEHPTQDGFGWTHGSYVAMRKRWP